MRMKSFLMTLSVVVTSLAVPPAFSGPATPQKSSGDAPAKSAAAALEPKDQFDRLDGTGPSRVKVDVVEWEGNLELHVAPKGSLKGVGLKIDRTNKNKPVMVIAYRLNSVTYTLTRRAILSIKLQDDFKTFVDPNEEDYDKILISNNTLSNVRPYALDSTPKQLYPDHYVAGEDPNRPSRGPAPAGEAAKSYGERRPSTGIQFQQGQVDQDDQDDGSPSFQKKPKTVDEDGGIKSFSF